MPESDNDSSSKIVDDKEQDPIEIKVIYNKKKYDVTTTSNTTILELKKQLQSLLGKYVQKYIPWKLNFDSLLAINNTLYNAKLCIIFLLWLCHTYSKN